MEKARYKCPFDHVATRVPLLKQVTKIKKKVRQHRLQRHFWFKILHDFYMLHVLLGIYIVLRFRIKISEHSDLVTDVHCRRSQGPIARSTTVGINSEIRVGRNSWRLRDKQVVSNPLMS